MPIDLTFYKNLSQKERYNLKKSLDENLSQKQGDLQTVEEKLKAVISQPNMDISDLKEIFKYRNDVKRDMEEIILDLSQIKQFEKSEQWNFGKRNVSTNSPVTLEASGGTVNIRPVKFSKEQIKKILEINKIPTFEKLMEDKKKKKK